MDHAERQKSRITQTLKNEEIITCLKKRFSHLHSFENLAIAFDLTWVRRNNQMCL